MCSTRDNHGGLQILKKYPTIALAFSNADSTPGLPGRFDMPPGWHWATTAEAAMVMGATTAGDTRHWLGPHGTDWNAENFLHRGSSKSHIRHKCGLSCYQTVATMRNGACGDFGRVCCDCVGDCVGRRRTPAANQNFPHSQLIWTGDCAECQRGLQLVFGMMHHFKWGMGNFIFLPGTLRYLLKIGTRVQLHTAVCATTGCIMGSMYAYGG